MDGDAVANLRRLSAMALAVGIVASATVANAQSGRASGGAVENDLSLVEAEVLGLERRVVGLRQELSAGSLTRSPAKITERYNEARYAYLVEQYELCALYLHSLIENDDLKGDPRRPEAEWYLAECLFLDGNLGPATDRFRRIVDQGPSHAFYDDSLLKLIELYGRTGNVRQFNEYYNNFVRSSQDSSPTALRIRYQMGKTLYRQGKLADAQALFAAFPRGSTFTPQARYFSGVILVAEGQAAAERGEDAVATQKYQQAVTVFREVLTLPISTEDHARVRDMTHLAIARLYYETQDIPSAIAEYTQIAADSVQYADALYEMIWANIEAASQMTGEQAAGGPSEGSLTFERQRKYDEALRAIEIFNLAFPDDAREPALRLLAGHVRVRMEKFEDAIERYEDAAVHFRELKGVVDQIVGSEADPMVYFNQLVDADYVTEVDLTVPPSARRQARRDEHVELAVQISGDLYREQADIEQASDKLDVIEEALYASEGLGLIQTYRIHRQQLAMAEAAVLMLRDRLIDLEVVWLDGSLTGGTRSALDSVKDQKVGSGSGTTALANRRQDAMERQEVFGMQARAVGTRLYNLEMTVQDLQGRLGATEEYLVDARSRGERTREQELELRKEIESERAFLAGVLDALSELRKRIEPRVLTARLDRAAVGAGDLDEERSASADALRSLEGRLGSLRASASGGGDVPRRIDAARSRLVDLERIALETREMMDRAELSEVEDVRKEVGFQRRMVTELDGEGTSIHGDNTRVSGRIGKQAFVDVAAFYEDMLTRADMGVADVYWYRKESTSKAKKSLAREKTSRLRLLQDAFRDVLEER